MKYTKLFIIITLAAIALSSCGTSAKLQKANAMYESGGYYEAANMYQKLLNKVEAKDRLLLNFRMGESFRIMNNTTRAEAAYKRVIANKSNTIEEAYLRYGEVLMMNKKYDEAIGMFNQYKELAPDDDRADKGIASCEMAKAHEEENKYADYIVENFSAVNSPSNDYAPAYGTADYEMLLFSSSKSGGKKSRKRQAGSGQRLSAIYYTQQGRDSKWSKPAMLGEEVNGKKDEDGACCFNSSYEELYFTKSIRNAGYEIDGCNIYVAKRSPSYDWSEAEMLEVNDSLMMAHPSISDDGLTLYFVSNMPGGFGGNDIWKMTRKTPSGMWENPENLGAQINTKDDELYPFIRANGELYFSSNGHPSYGGLDLFKATPTGNSWEVENMGPTFNSEVDDFSIIFEAVNERGYFASRRKGGKGGDDIYRFYQNIPVIEYIAQGIILNSETQKPISGAQVRLMGSNGASLIKNTEADGRYEFKLSNNTDYICIASASGYLNQKLLFTTEDLTDSHTFQDTLLLVSTDKPIEIPNIFYEFGKADLNPESRTALDELVEIMTDNPDIIVELAAHTDSRGTAEVNQNLSQRRAQAVVDYLIREGIDENRMFAVGYGKDDPKTVDKATSEKYPFLRNGSRLTDSYINTLKSDEEKEIAHQLNRRTELQVLNARDLRR